MCPTGTYLDVTMKQLPGMHVLEGFEQLVHDVLFVHLLEDVSPNDRVQVRLRKGRVRQQAKDMPSCCCGLHCSH
jgi:hypothetical protein